jgi:hypothetical protein
MYTAVQSSEQERKMKQQYLYNDFKEKNRVS